MKTPEEMAEEYVDEFIFGGEDRHIVKRGFKDAFLAGYQAAKDTYKDAISAYEDVAKQMLEEAVRIMLPEDQVADADKVMPLPAPPKEER